MVAEADPRPGARLGRMSFAGKSAVEEVKEARTDLIWRLPPCLLC